MIKHAVLSLLLYFSLCAEEKPDRPLHFHEMHEMSYLDYVKYCLDECDCYLSEGNVEFARVYHETACQVKGALTKIDAEVEIRTTFHRLVIRLIYDKDKGAIKDFVKSLLDRVDYKDGKLIIEIESIDF